MSAKSRFVESVLKEEGDTLYKSQGRAVDRLTESHSGHLKSARSVSVQVDDGYSGTLTYTHAAYERLLDMRRITRGGKAVKRKRRRIHNRYVYGALGSIAARLMNDFTDETAERIEDAFKEG